MSILLILGRKCTLAASRAAHWQVTLSPVHTSNNVETTFDFVTFDNVASTLLLVWTEL